MKNLFTLFAVLGLVGLFSACSSDDKNDPAPVTVMYDGLFKGDLEISVGGSSTTPIEDEIEIIKTGENRATLQLNNFIFNGENLGDIVITDVKVTQNQDKANLKGKADVKLKVGDCKVDVVAEVSGDNLTAKIDVEAVAPESEGGGVQYIQVVFNGTRTEPIKSSEAKILTFTLQDIKSTNFIVDKDFTFLVDYADNEKIKKALPIATISDKATISPKLDIPQDFSEPVIYTVTAEDGVTTAEYTVVVGSIAPVVAFDMSTAVFSKHDSSTSINESALPNNKTPFSWSSSDPGVSFTIAFGKTDHFGVTHVEKDSEFDAPVFSIETQDTEGDGMIPKITSGSMFLGSFELNMFAALKSTKFGVPVDKKLLKASGSVSYKSGEEYFKCINIKVPGKAELVPGKKDAGLISAVVYEIEKDDDTLDGTNLYTSDKIIGIGKLAFEDGFKDDFEFDIEYTKEFDSTKKYKLALVLSASKDGDKFSGAGGSVLKVAKLELNFE